MEVNAVKLKDDASFEILPSVNGDEYYSSSLYSSSWKSSQFETSSYTPATLSEADETEDINLGGDLEIVSKGFFLASLEHLTPSFDQRMQSPKNAEFDLNKDPQVDQFSGTLKKDSNSSIAEEGTEFCAVSSSIVTESVEKNDCQVFKLEGETLKQHQQVEKTESYLRDKSLYSSHTEAIYNSNTDIFICDRTTASGSRRNHNSNCHITHEEFGTIVNKCSATSLDNTAVQIYTGREKRPKKTCCILKQSLKMYRWLRDNKCLQNLVTEAKSSFHSFLNLFETEVNLMLGMENRLRIIIIANTVESRAIREAFLESYCGQITISKCFEIEDASIPVLPVGYNSALQAVQSKINIVEMRYDFDNCAVVISTTIFIVENVPQRWQMSTVLCLEDPKLGLNLHNFSLTTPVPNEYISLAQRLTPEDYPLKERGLAVTLQDAIRSVIRTDSNDTQEFLTGVDHFVTLNRQ